MRSRTKVSDEEAIIKVALMDWIRPLINGRRGEKKKKKGIHFSSVDGSLFIKESCQSNEKTWNIIGLHGRCWWQTITWLGFLFIPSAVACWPACYVLTFNQGILSNFVDGNQLEINLELFRFEFRIKFLMVGFSTLCSTFSVILVDTSRSADFISNLNERTLLRALCDVTYNLSV